MSDHGAVMNLKDLLDGLYGHHASSVYLKDENGFYLYNNAYAIQIMKEVGLSSDMTLRSDHELFPKQAANMYQSNDRIVFDTRERLMIEEPICLSPSRRLKRISIKKAITSSQTGLSYILGQTIDYGQIQYNRIKASVTKRELECMGYMFRGYTAKEIAVQLVLSPRTVETHFNNLRAKLGIQTRRELTQMAIENDLIPLLLHLTE